jgi:hypothetical protein
MTNVIGKDGAMLRRIIVAALLYAGAQPVVAAQPGSSALSSLFQPETLNSSLEWVEHQWGPAKYVEGDNRTYIIDGCKVTIGYVKNAVRNLGIETLGNQCNFDLKRFYPDAKIGQAASLTFGALDDALGGNSHPLPECLASCGNSADPAMNMLREGSHAENFISVLVSNDYPYRGPQAAKSLDALMNRMKAEHGINYLTEGKGDCDRHYEGVERALFRDVAVKTIRVGWDLDDNPARCGRN